MNYIFLIILILMNDFKNALNTYKFIITKEEGDVVQLEYYYRGHTHRVIYRSAKKTLKQNIKVKMELIMGDRFKNEIKLYVNEEINKLFPKPKKMTPEIKKITIQQQLLLKDLEIEKLKNQVKVLTELLNC